MKKLVIIPAYNESESIENTIRSIIKDAPDFDYIVVNDCSRDSTEDILKSGGYSHISLPVNLGIGGAMQTGYRFAKDHNYDVAAQIDGDGQHDVRFLKDMLELLEKENADMVIGSRFIDKEGFQSTKIRRAGISYFTWLIRVLTGSVIHDPTSGMRLVNRSVIEMFADRYPSDYPEPESVVSLLRNGRKVLELPVVMRERQGGISSIRFSGSIYYMIKVTIAIMIERTR